MRCKVFSIPMESTGARESESRLNEFLLATNVKRTFASLVNQPTGPIWSVLFFYEEGPAKSESSQQNFRTALEPSAPLTREQGRVMGALRKWRAEEAAAAGIPLYMVAQNKWLEDIVRMPARTTDDLLKIDGLGERRVQKYGTKILEILKGSSGQPSSWASPPYNSARPQ